MVNASGKATVEGQRGRLVGRVAQSGNATVTVKRGDPRIRTVAIKRRPKKATRSAKARRGAKTEVIHRLEPRRSQRGVHRRRGARHDRR